MKNCGILKNQNKKNMIVWKEKRKGVVYMRRVRCKNREKNEGKI